MYIRALLQVEPLEGYYVLTMQRATKTRHREGEVLVEVIASRMQAIPDFFFINRARFSVLYEITN
jgi:hypothetical protein